MKRLSVVLHLCCALSAVVTLAQSNSAEPTPASGIPKVPMSGTQASGPATTSQQAVVRTNPPAGSATPAEPVQPKTEILDSSGAGSAMATDGHDPLLDPAPPPEGTTTLVGGTVTGVDHIRNRMSISVFGGGHWKVAFDERTHIFNNGTETTQLAIRKGERVYVDTTLDSENHQIFARNIRLGVTALPADADGQIASVDPARSTVVLRDKVNAAPVLFSVNGDTRIVYGTNPASFNDLRPGSLIHVKFSPDRPGRGLAREISIAAAPGSAFTFVGKITYLDTHRGILALQNVLDQKVYEIHFDPARTDVKDSLGMGREVRIVAVFEGTGYTAQSITLTGGTAAKE
jgi:Domain of unknown function (DUF5666)